jgi:3-deoxy-7-phosphoheptulonate synthase
VTPSASDRPLRKNVGNQPSSLLAYVSIDDHPMSYPMTDDLRIQWTELLLPPAFFERQLPISEKSSVAIHQFRSEIAKILEADDHRLLVVVGPCSIHDARAAREYAVLLKGAIEEFGRELRLVMRLYLEKPRTTVGWKGLINDPYLDQSFKINDGLRLARHLLVDLAEMGVPAGTEFLDMIIPEYLAGLVSWGAIGARTTESQLHRQRVSGLACPVGFKNSTSGDVQVAIEAIQSAAHPHCFLGLTKNGQSAIFVTTGNPLCHVILRGGRTTVNYKADSISQVACMLEKAGLPPRLMIDCSHDNSRKDHRQQPSVCREVAEQIRQGNRRIIGVMMESNLVAGAQKLVVGQSLVYGKSITDPCMGWQETHDLLRLLAEAVRTGR